MPTDFTERQVPATASTPGLQPPVALAGRFGQFELLDSFSGGMGAVFRARHTVLDRVVALKVLAPGRPLTDDDRRRFETEAKAIEQLRHPHIVAIHEFGECDGRPYFTMDFVEGSNLAKRAGEFAGQPKRAAALVEKIARAVHHAHERGVLHRDLKPANILMRGPDDPVVADFGLARLADGDVSLTATGAVIGTPPYMAPEQFLARHDLFGPPTDVWALGVILHELLTGRRPFAGSARDEVQSTVLTMEPQPPSVHDGSVPPTLDAVVLRCLCREPADRYQSAKELADDLALWQAGQRPKTRRPLTRAARRRRRRLAVTVAVLLIVALTVFGGALIWWYSLDPEARARRELKETGSVRLVGETGPPRCYRELTENIDIVSNSKREPFTLKSNGLGLLEFMTTTDQDRYRFRGELQLVEGAEGAEVGLYVGRESFPRGKPEWYSIIAALCVRREPTPGQPEPGGEFYLKTINCQPPTPTGGATRMLGRARFEPDRPGGDRWILVEFEMTSNHIVADATFPGQRDPRRLGDWDRVKLEALRLEVGDVGRPAAVPITPTYDPSSGIGLYVRKATVRVRNVVVEKLP
jgi:serine/threonine-protein kinase